MQLLVMAKSPVPGAVKTRLCPPCSPEEAAAVAAAALSDTLEAVAGCRAERRILALEGPVGDWLPTGFELIGQRGDGLGERLGAAWVDAGDPGVQIGMDTPQVTSAILDDALGALDASMAVGGREWPAGDRALLGPAEDGGWWAIALSRPAPEVFAGVPMSNPDTALRQRERLDDLGWTVGDLPPMRDIDVMADLIAVSWLIPASRTAATAARLAAAHDPAAHEPAAHEPTVPG